MEIKSQTNVSCLKSIQFENTGEIITVKITAECISPETTIATILNIADTLLKKMKQEVL